MKTSKLIIFIQDFLESFKNIFKHGESIKYLNEQSPKEERTKINIINELKNKNQQTIADFYNSTDIDLDSLSLDNLKKIEKEYNIKLEESVKRIEDKMIDICKLKYRVNSLKKELMN